MSDSPIAKHNWLLGGDFYFTSLSISGSTKFANDSTAMEFSVKYNFLRATEKNSGETYRTDAKGPLFFLGFSVYL